MDYQTYRGLRRTSVETEHDRDLELLDRLGYFVVPEVFSNNELEQLRAALDAIWDRQLERYGAELLSQIGDYGVCRAMMADDPLMLELIVHPVLLKYVDSVIGETAILHLQNGIILFPDTQHNQGRFHRDFPKDFLTTTPLSFNTFIAVDEFTVDNGATWVVPGSHRFVDMPSPDFISRTEVQVSCPAGSLICFDSLLWHRGGVNRTNRRRRAINQQYTRPFVKQQLDYPAMMRDRVVKESKLAQTLGMWTIPPKSLDEYRVLDPARRTYRAGQG